MHPHRDAAAGLSRYEPLTRLATGGMAEIWLALEQGAAGLERFVVIKRLLPHLARDKSIVDMFVSEARFVARLVHPNVVQIHELAEDAQGYFLVMEYVAGCSVRELMAAAGKADEVLAPEVAIGVIEQACRGVHAAHELTDAGGRPLGLVHRDISPHNLMIGPGGDVKLLDFGIAKATAAADATQTGSLKGKTGYMSPEQCRAKPLDRRSDVFALGVVLWELLVGERLFARDSEYESMDAVVSGDVQPPSEARPGLPAALDAVVLKALEKNVDARWQTADELRRALLDAAEASGLRSSRDALLAKVVDLMGDRLEQRQDALRRAANRAYDDPAALQHALLGSDPGLHQSASGITGRSRALADDVPTVVQRDSSRPSGDHEHNDGDTAVDRTPADPASDETTPLPSEPAAEPAPPVAEPSRWRWRMIALLALAACAAAVAIDLAGRARAPAREAARPQDQGQPAAAGPPLRFVVPPTVEPEVIRREMAPFADWLGRALERRVDVVIADSYEDGGAIVASSRAELGLLPPLLFVQTVAREPRVRPVALRLYDGSRSSDGYLLVRDDATLDGAADLRGRTLCLVDRESTTGFLLPRIWLRGAGLDPDHDVTTILSGDHLAALRDLSAGRCEAAAVYSGAYLSARQQGIRVGALRVLAITGRVPQDVVAAAPLVPDAEIARLQELLVAFEPERDIDAARVGSVLGISGFAKFDPAELELIRDAALREGLLPGGGAGR